MKFRMGEIIRGEIWEIQIIKTQQPSSNFYKSNLIQIDCNILILYHSTVL